MKKTLLFLLAVCFAGLTHAQYYYLPHINSGTNPGGWNMDDEYPVGGGLPAGWATILNPNSTPIWSSNQTLPFSFMFNGSPVTSFKVSNTACLTFDVGTAVAAPSSTPGTLPSASIPNSSVVVWGIIGNTANSDYVVTKTFGSAPNRQFWVFFSSYSIPGNASAWSYWSIVLEETSNKIYVVDQRTANGTPNLTVGVQVNGTTATMVSGSPAVSSYSNNDPTAADNSYYEFIQGTQSAYDMSATALTTSSYVAMGSNNITGTLINFGSTTITSLDINYKINGGAAVTATLNGLNIAANATYNFTHPTPWVSSSTGTYIVQVYASNLNGNADQNTGNDIFTGTVNVLTQNIQRIPLFEVFTSSTCAPCAPGNINFHNVVDPLPAQDFVFLKFQEYWPGTGDPYTTQESRDRVNFYSINSIPRQEIDGGWDGNAGSFTTQLYNAARAIPAEFALTGTYIADTTAKTFSAKVIYSPLFDASNTTIQVAIIENTTDNNIKSNGETEFYHVMKKMVPGSNGTVLPSMTAGTVDSISVTYTFNGNYRLPVDGQTANMINHAIEHSVEEFSDLAMVGWAESTQTPRHVFQAHNFVKVGTTGIYEMSPNIESINIFPSPATDVTNVQFNMLQAEKIKVQLLDMEGRAVQVRDMNVPAGVTTITFDVSNLASGVYHVAVTDSHLNSFVRRIVVQ